MRTEDKSCYFACIFMKISGFQAKMKVTVPPLKQYFQNVPIKRIVWHLPLLTECFLARVVNSKEVFKVVQIWIVGKMTCFLDSVCKFNPYPTSHIILLASHVIPPTQHYWCSKTHWLISWKTSWINFPKSVRVVPVL